MAKAQVVSTGEFRKSLRDRFAVLKMCEHSFEELISHKVQGPWDKSGPRRINWQLVVTSRMQLETVMLVTLFNFPDESSFASIHLYRDGKYSREEFTEFQWGEEIFFFFFGHATRHAGS